MTKTEEHERYYDLYIPEQRQKEEENPPDLITVHINRDQVVCLTEDLLMWMFRKIKNGIRKLRKKKRKKVEDE